MHSKNIPLFLIVASLTSTSLGLHHLVVTARRSFDTILARQTTSGPCASICDAVDSTVSACTTPTCICTSANEASVQACVTCAVGADPSESVITSAQDLIESFEAVCSSVPGIPSVTINTNAGTGTPNTATLPGSNAPSTSVVPTTTVPQIVIGPSSTTSAPTTASSVGSTSTTSITGFPLKSSASPNKIILHWTVALLGLVAARNLLVF